MSQSINVLLHMLRQYITFNTNKSIIPFSLYSLPEYNDNSLGNFAFVIQSISRFLALSRVSFWTTDNTES